MFLYDLLDLVIKISYHSYRPPGTGKQVVPSLKGVENTPYRINFLLAEY
jgi:hypothetical protein